MLVDSIENGIVIDHLTAGLGLKVLSVLGVETRGDTVALIMNASSKKYGKKDLVKIMNKVDIDLAILGLIDPRATVNIIEDGKIVKKIVLTLPERVVNVVKCKNPRCVTTVEPNAPQVFLLENPATSEYRCEYCDEVVVLKGEWENELMHL